MKTHPVPKKPTVFLSHSSSNRRELVALKRLLDERAGGLIEFFLSSDDESIPHGTIWPEEVKAALDRMTLMLVFISPKALESGWTYFEAGYGLHKLDSANIYCLPGCEKAKLPSPFNLLQNRNLHSAKDVSLLLQGINFRLGAKLREAVTKSEFEQIFKARELGQVSLRVPLDKLIESVRIDVQGPSNSMECFSQVCSELNVPNSPASMDANDFASRFGNSRCSTGVRLQVKDPTKDYWFRVLGQYAREQPITLTETELKAKGLWIYELSEYEWMDAKGGADAEFKSLKEIRAYNKRLEERAEARRKELLQLQAGPRRCVLIISPLNFDLALSIADSWLAKSKASGPMKTTIHLSNNVTVEMRTEVLAAKIHGSEIGVGDDGALICNNDIRLSMSQNDGDHVDASRHSLTFETSEVKSISSFGIENLVSNLAELKVISAKSARSKSKKSGLL
ncbi:MAG: toll/interleukin-1 receptor domain-containing protein [Verrucomicrobiaceae bacterium]|nr:toll/interleukin-1 receptor domain-containing protein [Verrucomicrobiaceae bacterium]